MGRIPKLLGGGSEEEPGPIKFKGRCRKSFPPTWGEGQRGARPFLLAVLPDWFLLPSSPQLYLPSFGVKS